MGFRHVMRECSQDSSPNVSQYFPLTHRFLLALLPAFGAPSAGHESWLDSTAHARVIPGRLAPPRLSPSPGHPAFHRPMKSLVYLVNDGVRRRRDDLPRGEGKQETGGGGKGRENETKEDGYFETVQNVDDFGTDNIGEEKCVKGKW